MQGIPSDQHYKKFRCRPHKNPLSDLNIILPSRQAQNFPFEKYFPNLNLKENQKYFTLVDLGCGYGDYIKTIYPYFNDQLLLGLEIRHQPNCIAQQQLLDEQKLGKAYNTLSLQCNVMKQLPQLLKKNSVKYFTLLYQDPQFKQKQQERRVVSRQMICELRYYLQKQGYIIICTDVQELFNYEKQEIECFSDLHQLQISNDQIQDQKLPVQDIKELNVLIDAMKHTADAERHQRKDNDKTVYKAIYRYL